MEGKKSHLLACDYYSFEKETKNKSRNSDDDNDHDHDGHGDRLVRAKGRQQTNPQTIVPKGRAERRMGERDEGMLMASCYKLSPKDIDLMLLQPVPKRTQCVWAPPTTTLRPAARPGRRQSAALLSWGDQKAVPPHVRKHSFYGRTHANCS